MLRNKYIGSILFLILIGAYYHIGSTRILPFFILALWGGIILKTLMTPRYYLQRNNSLMPALILLSYAGLISIYSNSWQVFLSLATFFSLMYWPLIIVSAKKKELQVVISKAYLSAAIVTSLGIIIQSVLYKYYNYSLGLFGEYGGGRIAFGFLWSDFSFASLFIVTSVPFILELKSKLKFFIIVLIVIASIITSARTGIASLIIVFFFKFVMSLPILIRKKNFYKGISIFTIGIIFFIVLQDQYQIMNRQFTLNGSGRIAGYIDAINYWMDNFWFGSMLDEHEYEQQIGVIPHNLFIYPFAIGGILYALFFFMWLFTVCIEIMSSKNKALKFSFYIALVGMLFIPSFFSGYFIAILLSMNILQSNQRANY